MTSLSVLVVLLCCPGLAMACPNTAGVVIGSILGTLVVAGAVFAVVFLLLHKRRKAKEDEEKKLGGTAEHTYVNPSFDGTEMYSPTPVKTVDRIEEATAHKDKGFQGYVECREYDSPNKNSKIEEVSAVGQSASTRRNLDAEFRHSQQRDVGKPGPLQKSGSRGSLDNSFNAMDPETVSVYLESQDIIGLGFNICGNLRDGIFVREVLNRGPASESGLIKAGDRILGITISFENMVFEDALTILSYASPYPVKLKLQKEAPVSLDEQKSPAKSEADAKGDLHHPLYKSQSMDDIRQITQDGLLGPRRTFSEMKRSGPLPKSVEEGHLKKWKNKQELVNEESSVSETDYAHSSVSNFSIPDATESKVDVPRSGDERGLSAEVQIHMPDANLEKSVSLNEIPAEKLDEFTRRKAASEMNLRVDVPDVKVDLDNSNIDEPADVKLVIDAENAEDATGAVSVEMPEVSADESEVSVDVPDVKQSDISADVTNTVNGVTSEIVETACGKVEIVEADVKDKIEDLVSALPGVAADMIEPAATVSIETEGEPIAPRRKRLSTGSSEKSDAETEDKKVKLDENKNTEVEVDVEMLKEKVALIENDLDEDNSGQIDFMDVDVDLNGDFRNEKVRINHEDKKRSTEDDNEDEVVEIEEDQMRAVLRDYFGDQPSLLQQFGMSGSQNGEEEEASPDDDGQDARKLKDSESPDSGVVGVKKGSSSDSPTSSRSSSPERKSKSPNIRRKSGGGLAFDITATEFNDLPDEIPQERRSTPKGGMAYYVRIDDQHNPTPSKGKGENLSQPPLVKAPESQTTSYQMETSETNHVDGGTSVVQVQKIEITRESSGGETTVGSKSSKITLLTNSEENTETPYLLTVGDDSEA